MRKSHLIGMLAAALMHHYLPGREAYRPRTKSPKPEWLVADLKERAAAKRARRAQARATAGRGDGNG